MYNLSFIILIRRCAKRTSKDRASSQREGDLSASHTPARCPHHQIMYNSDTVYSTTTFRPVSPSPLTLPASSPSPQRTRKLETPLHFDGGLFSDIRSKDGKLLSKVTVDRLHSSSRHDVTDSPSMYESVGSHGNKDYVDDIIKTETITNEDVIKVKFTPVSFELDALPPRLLTPSQFQMNRAKTPVEYLKDTFEDLQSYKIVSSICKDKKFEADNVSAKDLHFDSLGIVEPFKRAPSPLANFLVSEQMTKIESYLQESLDACGSTGRSTPAPLNIEGETKVDDKGKQKTELYETTKMQCETSSNNMSSITSYHDDKPSERQVKPPATVTTFSSNEDAKRRKSKGNSVREKQPGVLSAIYNMPIHYHAAILCIILIVYNFIYQYIKQNCHGKNK